MSMTVMYGRDALRRLREQQEAPAAEPKPQLSLLEQVPPDAPMDEGLTLGCWNGERFVSWDKWRAAEPLK